MSLGQTTPTERAGHASPQALPAPVDLVPIRRNGPRLRVLCSCREWIDWRAASFVGVMQDDVERLELRNCPRCGSTRALVVASVEGRE